MSKPTAENLDVMLARLSNGDGMEVLAPAWFAVTLSLLPSNTLHEGPPDCTILHFINVTATRKIMFFFSSFIYVAAYAYASAKKKSKKVENMINYVTTKL